MRKNGRNPAIHTHFSGQWSDDAAPGVGDIPGQRRRREEGRALCPPIRLHPHRWASSSTHISGSLMLCFCSQLALLFSSFTSVLFFLLWCDPTYESLLNWIQTPRPSTKTRSRSGKQCELLELSGTGYSSPVKSPLSNKGELLPQPLPLLTYASNEKKWKKIKQLLAPSWFLFIWLVEKLFCIKKNS